MENYENLRSHRQEVKTRMDELKQTEEATHRIDDWIGNIDSQSQRHLEDRLRFYRDISYEGGNGFTLRKDLTDEDLLDRVVEGSVVKILKKEIRSRQKDAEKLRFSRRLHR